MAGRRVIGILLIGIGSDGAKGLRSIKEVGGYTLAQNEETATIFGMLKRAIELGAASEILALNEIVKRIVDILKD
ncbi:chemotaxis protein CheB [Halonatronum saccharophilum]|uniref:chemotaxis protein CheB n=1 Tax=Halonatronum saccharophilum TaxID=150060 RepID=UPI0004845AD5|nr:chemotaxis protein CheB [Halonatronum saccharophilum]